MSGTEFIRELENSQEFILLNKLAHEATTIEDVIQHLVDETMTALAVHGPTKHNGVGLPDYNVSSALMELVQRLEPAKHKKLVEFVFQLQKQVAIDPSTNEPLKTDNATLWTDLPSFGYTEYETWYEFGGRHKGKSYPISRQ